MRLNYKHTVIFFVSLTFICLGCTLSIADEIMTADATDTMVNELLSEIERTNKILKEKKFFPKVPPYPSTRDEYDKIEDDFYAATRVNIQIYSLLASSSYLNEYDKKTSSYVIKDNVKYKFKRRDRTELYLVLILHCREAIDPNFKHVELMKNVWSEPDPSDHTGQALMGGMLAEDIKHPKTRENYIKAKWENTKNGYESSLHQHLTEMVTDTEKSFTSFALEAYSQSPRADRELIDLLEKYKYPKDKMLKLLCDLEIPYKGFRNWESTDGLFKTTAKFISFEKDEVTIEKANGKRTSIELKYLRPVDKDFVNKQITEKIKPPDTH